jgi:AraC-like DNA-binding protein
MPMMDSSGFATIRFSTDDLPAKDRLQVWREYYGRSVLKVDIEPAPGTEFHSTISTRALPGLQVMTGTMSAARIIRTRKSIADGNDDLILAINGSGAVTVSAPGRELKLGKGEAVLMSGCEVTTFERHTTGGSLSLRIPRSVVASLVVDIDDVVMRKISHETDALKLLTGYLNPLLGETRLSSPVLRHLSVNHIKDLIAVALGSTGDAEEQAHDRGIPAARLKAAKAHIIENSRRSLSVGSVAVHLGVTPRYLQRLFEIEGTTFSAFLLGHRLTRAYRMLRDPRYDGCTVETIACDSGFGDISYFNRCFRRLYGVTPKEVRKQPPERRLVEGRLQSAKLEM